MRKARKKTSAAAYERSSAAQRPDGQVAKSPGTATSPSDDRLRLAIAAVVIAIACLPLIAQLTAPVHGDVQLYQAVANDLFNGKLPYRDRVLEYPPYATGIFALPRVLGANAYPVQFMVLVLLADSILKGLLFVAGAQRTDPFRWLLPLVLYSATIPFVRYFYLQRYDIWPALACLLAVGLFSTGRFVLSGVAIGLGIGLKFYPIIFGPPMLMLAVRQHKGVRFMAGLVASLLPIVLLSFVLPWWRFAEFQSDRGLQVESLYASILWFGKLLGWTQLRWEYIKNWYEVRGTLAEAVLPWSRLMFAAAVGGSTLLVTWTASHKEKLSAPQLARLLLVPLLGFVAFNQILSPQYMIWLLPLAALASLEGNFWPPFAIALATLLTPWFFPVPDYFEDGLNLFHTIILLLRNLLLVVSWMFLVCAMVGGRALKQPTLANQSSSAVKVISKRR